MSDDMLGQLLLQDGEGIGLGAVTWAGFEDLAWVGAHEAVSADLFGSGGLEEERVLRVGRLGGVVGDFEIGGGWGDEVRGDLAVEGHEGGLEGGFGWFLDDFADVVEGRDDGSLVAGC